MKSEKRKETMPLLLLEQRRSDCNASEISKEKNTDSQRKNDVPKAAVLDDFTVSLRLLKHAHRREHSLLCPPVASDNGEARQRERKTSIFHRTKKAADRLFFCLLSDLLLKKTP